MNPVICITCENPGNQTSNRLVTESCGHVKCIDCLVKEKSGCAACIVENDKKDCEDSLEQEVGLSVIDHEPVETDESANNVVGIVEDRAAKKCSSFENCSLKKILERPQTSHIKIEEEGKTRTYFCTKCDKRFQARSQVFYHAYCNVDWKPYECTYPGCGKGFISKSHYNYHMRVHGKEKSFSCEFCGEGFYLLSKLQRHKLKHTNERKYSCSECGKSFNNTTALRRHGLTHTKERPFGCDTCGRRFRDVSNYKKHVDKHKEGKCVCKSWGRDPRCLQHAARQYQCPRCPQAFRSKKDMRRHAQVHTDSKPFRCKVCDRRFRRKDNLERHIRNTHPDSTPSNAVECDENELSQAKANGTAQPEKIPEKVYENHEKFKLEIMNPLPPLPQEVIQKHIDETPSDPVIDKSYIIEANIARQSVIVAQCTETRKSSPLTEYVHKMRKANSMRSQNDMPLPPIDESKLIQLVEHDRSTLDIGPLPEDTQTLKNILSDNKRERGSDEGKKSHPMHWRRKMTLENINW